MADKPLPDNAPDNFVAHDDSIDSLIGTPGGPEALDQAQKEAVEIQQLRAENHLLRAKYNLYDAEDSRENLFREELDAQVERVQEFMYTEEGEKYLRGEVLQDWAAEKPKERTSDDVYKETYQERKKREYQEAKESS
jgi:hypothetical protein